MKKTQPVRAAQKKASQPTAKQLTEKFVSAAEQGSTVVSDGICYTIIFNPAGKRVWSDNTYPFRFNTSSDGKSLTVKEEGRKPEKIAITVTKPKPVAAKVAKTKPVEEKVTTAEKTAAKAPVKAAQTPVVEQSAQPAPGYGQSTVS